VETIPNFQYIEIDFFKKFQTNNQTFFRFDWQYKAKHSLAHLCKFLTCTLKSIV
jgi:hypothetical protein